MKLLKNKINCPYANVTCNNWECENCEEFEKEKKNGNKLLRIKTNVKPPQKTIEEQSQNRKYEIINKLVDNLIKENEELKEEIKKLEKEYKELEEIYKDFKEEINKELA